MHVDRPTDRENARAQEHSEDTLKERRVQLLARAMYEGKIPQAGLDPEILARAKALGPFHG